MKAALLLVAPALTLAACTRDVPRAVTKLDCPSTEGKLTRVSIAADGKSCVYRSSDGAEINIELTPIVGTPQQTLDRIEADLRSTPGPMTPEAESAQAEAGAKIAGVASVKANVSSMAAEVARVQAEAAADAGGPSSAPKLDEEGGNRVDLPGIRISEHGDSANVRIGPLQVDADGDETTVNFYRDVRMRGEALSREKRGLRATFVYTGKDLPSGYRYVGFEAGGPKAGPLTVAKVRSKSDTHSGEMYEDVQELVRRNGGV